MTLKLDVLIVQIIHIAILFWIFKKIIGDSLANALTERKDLMKKLEHAEDVFKQRIKDAEEEAEKIIQEGLNKKVSIIAEAGAVATKRQQEILDEASRKAESVLHDAEKRAQALSDDLEKNFTDGLKKTAVSVVKKLIWGNKELENAYLDSVVKEFKKS